MRFDLVVVQSPPPPDGILLIPLPAIGAGAAAQLVRRAPARPAAEVVDAFLRGMQAAPGRGNGGRQRGAHEAFALRDLALALVDLAQHTRAKATIRQYDEPWELCVERFGATACLSAYRAGPEPLVAFFDHAVGFDDLVSTARDAIDQALSAEQPPGAQLELATAAAQLSELAPAGLPSHSDVPELLSAVVEPERDSPLAFATDFAIREGAPSASSEPVERADLHALLFRGRLRAEIRGRTVDLGETHPVLFAERLVESARRAFDAWERGLALQARSEVAGILLGMRVSAEGELALTLGGAHGDARRTVHTFPALGVADVLEASLAFGRSLLRAILRRDRSQAANLRLSALRRVLRDSTEALRSANQEDSKVNPSPEPYRAFAAALAEARTLGPAGVGGNAPAAARLRYAPRWRTIVPGIDLRATYLCGDRVIVGAATEMWALDRDSGRVLWRSDVPRGTSVVTPGGVARLAPDGTFAVYDFGSGERTLRTRLAPRAGAPVAGAVVHLPGLPRLVVVTEGEHHLVAIDLTTGEPRWRWSWGARRGTARRSPRMKRAGRLIYFTCGDGALTALDVATGAVVWRLRDRLRFRTPPTVGRDALFVVSGGAHGVAKLYCIDPYAGHVRWSAALADPSAPCTIEGAPLVANGAVAVVVRQKSGVTLALFRQDDGVAIGDRERRRTGVAVAPVGTSWLGVDDAFIGNAPTGELVAVDARSGSLRWRHLLGPRPLEADIPRRLEPVLRGGALFVPCSLVTGVSANPSIHSSSREDFTAAAGICIVRPGDGAMLGSIAPTETIPDLLRVDEQCHVYIAEESGHLATFAALPRLSLVRPLAG
jgi:outer membrane protein assembly factor BamB